MGLIESHSISQRWRSPAASLWRTGGEWAAEFDVNSCSCSSSWYHGNRSVTYVGGNVDVQLTTIDKRPGLKKPSRDWLAKVNMQVIRKYARRQVTHKSVDEAMETWKCQEWSDPQRQRCTFSMCRRKELMDLRMSRRTISLNVKYAMEACSWPIVF